MAQQMTPEDAIQRTHGMRHKLLGVPTEVVISADQPHYSLQFRYARYWRLLTGERVMHEAGGGWYNKPYFITEVWNDQGDDGHTDYVLAGYRRCDTEEEVRATYLSYE